MPTLSQLTLGIFADDPYAALDVELVPSEHPHARARIRDAVVQRLRAAALLPDVIKPMRATPIALRNVPAIFVYTLQESEAEVYAEGPLIVTRDMDLAVHIALSDAGLPEGVLLEDALDALAAVVEVVLCNDRSHLGALSGEAARCVIGATAISIDPDGERLLAQAGLTFRVSYQQDFAVPVEHALEQVHIDWDLSRPPRDGVIDARDRVLTPRTAVMRGAIRVTGRFVGTVTP